MHAHMLQSSCLERPNMNNQRATSSLMQKPISPNMGLGKGGNKEMDTESAVESHMSIAASV
eukprot:867375-Lingulodinium_polyedra.AAC.1